MVDLLENKQQELTELCARYGVARLYVFGSALRDDFQGDTSDLNLLVQFGPMELHARVDAYLGLLDELEALFGREIDLVMVGAVKHPHAARQIEQTMQLLYAA